MASQYMPSRGETVRYKNTLGGGIASISSTQQNFGEPISHIARVSDYFIIVRKGSFFRSNIIRLDVNI